ncbi:serine/threonine-protein kinase PRP4 homolog isoform X2 [Pectinophora gossypiella]|nr:serine/threonine-protein kinase PRP4 homolog isoform X2 [Pectinophora gossypiella]XP_049876882.1 serine/threonine-protein kinase PRP4 homolog isoform X2 [Pectinophora gossypiella]XP_049876883.1 serine/threonine-protein kinase PRP4 homolog isoform X2 [Pectinophora gossypiella]XP_049876884.1 serine/threonine-protein kinase PRP4 homolog isoform X2 [Pectinophora gossypiella]XP_049876885.1 serine/threonine-protein kinase PRP4 homolog isoform X2 [Pectinophora gossypiella]XP_049876886.1 serine/thr
MSDKNAHSKSKTYKNYKREEISKSRSRNKSHKDENKRSKMESRTPPLPTRRTSIEELIKKRESLKQELKKIAKHSEGDLTTKPLSAAPDKHSKSDYMNNMQSRKRHKKDLEDSNIARKKPMLKDPSPEHTGDFAQAESEDEEALIEKSRQRRKLLLEKLSTSNSGGNAEDRMYASSHKYIESRNESINISTSDSKPSSKQTTDMFCETDDFSTKKGPDNVTQDNTEKDNLQLTDNWDDSEGYYNVRVGDEIDNNRYIIKSILGQGVFASVVRAQDNNDGNTDVAIKIIRNNELMHKTGLKEIHFLKEIKQYDPENKYHCVRLIHHFLHKNHLCMVLESLYMDMRGVIKKYGKHHGINMKALVSYSRQLLVALRLLKKIGIIHADIKPDNILVNEKKNVLKLCDFGSASKSDVYEPTPYLVSRFYRAPEIILGIPFKHSVDIWSTACTMFEMATGKIMFTGSSNNKMLKCFMDLKGKFSAKFIRKGKFKDQHFNHANNFLLHKKDEFTGREKVVEMNNINVTRDLHKELQKYCKNPSENSDKKILQLRDILDKMLILDMNHRYSVTDCLRHPFIQEELQK